MSKVEVGQQTEKAVDNAIESMQKNIKFKRVVNFSITVLEETCALAGTNCQRNCEFVVQRKGYRQVINVILHHSSNLELSKKSCIILKQLLKECTDSQLPSRMVEGHCAEALQLMIETPPEKDDETKELVLEILNYLFLVKGVLHKIVAKHGKGILKMFMNTDKPKMAQAVIECLQNTASEGLEELENEALAKMNLLVKSHQNDMAVCVSGSEYIKSLFENSDFERIKQCGITSRDIIISFGPYNMDDKIFRNLDVAIDKMGTDEEFYSVLDELLRSPKSDDFWIMSHLVDRPSLDIEGKKEQINSIIKLCDTKDLVKSLNSEVCFFLKELHRSRPELSKTLMKEKSLLIKKVMDEIDCIKGPYKFIGLQVLQQNLEDHSKFMRDNDIIQKSEKWMRECESPEDMRQILSFLESFCDDKELKKDMMAANLHKLAIQKCQNEFKGKPETFSALYSYLSKCIPGDDAINDFCESGYMGRTFDMAASMVDEIKDLEKFMDFTTKVVGTPKAAAKLTGSFDSMTKLFCTLFEKRIIDFFNKWYTDRNKKEVWATNYRPEFLDIISTEKERDALRKAFSGYDLSKIETPIHASAIGDKGIDVLAQLSQNMATFVCFLAKDDPDTLNTLNYRVLIGDSVQSLKNNIEFLTEKTLKLHVVPRYMAMFCMLLPLFKQKPYVKKVSSKKSEFCYLEFIQFIELAAPRHPILAYYTLASYGLYTIPRNLKPEKTIAATEGDAEDTKGAAAYEDSVWTPLTIILNDNPVSSSIVDSLAKTLKRVGEPIQNFVGYLSLTMSFLYGTQDGDIILSSQLVGSIISSVNDETLDPQLAISAIYSMDCWCETSEKAIITLNNLGSYDKLLRYMNNLRGQDILKLVISSLLQKLANYTDGAQLEYDLERLVKKCKDYDEFRATKGDELREDALSAYNELSGLLQIKKAQQYCLNKNLQNVTLNTLAFELRRDPEEMLSKGLIVNYQDLLNQLLSANSSLYENAKSKPDDHKNMTSVLQNVLKKWRNDPVITRNTLELTKAVIRKKGQLELNAQQTKELHTDLLALQSLYKNDPEIIALSNDVINLLDFQSIKEVVEPEPAIHIPDAPVSEEQVEEAEVYIAPQVDTIAEEEQNAKDLQEGFITEEVFASVQEAVNFIREEAAAEQKQEEATLFDSDFNDTTTGPETPQSETDDLNMRDENDRNRAFNALCKKVENPADNSQDELITKAQKKLDEIEIDELALAIYYAKWIAKSTSKPETTPQVGNPSLKLRANLEKFAGHVELLKYTCSATAAAGKASPELVQTIMESDLITVERQYIVTQHKPDPSTLNYFSKTVKHCANTEENKIAISQKGVIRVFTNALNPLKHESETVLASVLQAVNAINSSKQSCPINMDKTEFIQRFIDFGAEMIANVEFIKPVLESFGVIFKYGGEKVRHRSVELGVTELYSEVFMTYRDDDEVMKYLYPSAGNIGDIPSFWKTLDSVQFTDFVFSKLTSYTLDTAKSAMVCLVLLTKQDSICDKVVFDGHYRWLDPAIRQHNDNVILSFSLVIENALTATMKRQIKLNEERLYDVVTQYQEDVTKSKNDKLLMLWLSVLCKLTNSDAACENIMSYLYPALDGLIREHYYNEPLFEKFYNLMTNVVLSANTYINEIDSLLQLSFHKHSVATYTENFFLMYVNLLEKLAEMRINRDVQALLDTHKDSIMNTLHGVPLLLRNITGHLQNKFDIKFPRKLCPPAIQPFLKTSLDAKTINLLHTGSPCKRYRPGAVIETGTLFMDKPLKHLVFQKANSVSLMSRDIIFLGDLIKIVKGFDDRSAFIEAIQKYNLSIPQDTTIMMLSSKISYGETGFYIQFNNYDARTLWKESLRVFLEEIPQQGKK